MKIHPNDDVLEEFVLSLDEAVEAERADAELVAKVAAYLRRAEGDPGLQFEAGGGVG